MRCTVWLWLQKGWSLKDYARQHFSSSRNND